MSKIGIAAYGFCHRSFPRQKLLAILEKQKTPCLSILWNTFSDYYTPLEVFLRFPQHKILEIQAINEVGHRNKRLGKYEILYGIGVDEYRQRLSKKDEKLTTKLNRYFERMAEMLSCAVDTRLLISPGLETNLDPHAFGNLSELIKSHLPGAEIVYSPVGTNKFGYKPLPGYLYELHGATAGPGQIANNDGVDIALGRSGIGSSIYIDAKRLPAYIKRQGKAEIVFLWTATMNGLRPGPFVDPRRRVGWPKNEELNLLSGYI